MSLTSFVCRPEVRKRFSQEFPKPRIATDLDLLAAPQSKRYSLVGTAFDYLLRFHVERLNPKVHTRRWVAEAGLRRLALLTTSSASFDVETDQVSFADESEALKIGRRILARARAAHDRYIASGAVTDSLLKGVIGLARLDAVFRSRLFDEDLEVTYPEDMRDLRKLLSLVDSEKFRAKKLCCLNPTFGVGSKLIGGADADLLVDGTLIDVKATKNLTLKRDDFNQLVGYFALSKIWGIDGPKRKARIARVGIYFARYGSLQTFDVEKFVNDQRFPDFLRWFETAVART